MEGFHQVISSLALRRRRTPGGWTRRTRRTTPGCRESGSTCGDTSTRCRTSRSASGRPSRRRIAATARADVQADGAAVALSAAATVAAWVQRRHQRRQPKQSALRGGCLAAAEAAKAASPAAGRSSRYACCFASSCIVAGPSVPLRTTQRPVTMHDAKQHVRRPETTAFIDTALALGRTVTVCRT